MEQELRSQISALSSTERGIRSEMGQLRQENELLQNKYVHLGALSRASWYQGRTDSLRLTRKHGPTFLFIDV